VKIFAQNAGITAANAGKLMPASELSTDKNQVLNGGEGGIRTRLTARLDAGSRVSVTKKRPNEIRIFSATCG
jgi:hypothetical protein